MSDQGRPRNPFGRGDRTIIRPNPGGRLPTPPGANPAPPPSPVPPSAYPPSLPPSAHPTPPGAPAYPSPLPPAPGAPQRPGAPPYGYPAQYAPAPTTPSHEDWISAPAPAAVPAQPYSEGPRLRVDDLAAPNANPIMRAAGPLLQLLGRLRVALLRAPFASLMEQVAEAIKFFEKDIRSAGISEQQANSAKYILCATADDIVQHIPTEDRHVWTQYSMLSRFFGERIGGVRFFEILNHAKLDPLVNYPVLELLHSCLALGFQGVYRTQPGGLVTLQQIQRDLYEILRRVRPKVMRDLAVHWQGQQLPATANRFRVPVWVLGSLAGALLFGLFVTLRLLLGGNSETAADMMATLHPLDKVALQRHVVAPPPKPPPPPPPNVVTQTQRIKKQLPTRIGDCDITVDEQPNQLVIRVCSSITFASGSDRVLDQFKGVASKIAAALNGEPGKITVIGHTDNDPIGKWDRFKSNFALSVARATAVAKLIKASLTDPNRVDVKGKGPDAPITSNATAEGKAKNRRVEVTIARERE